MTLGGRIAGGGNGATYKVTGHDAGDQPVPVFSCSAGAGDAYPDSLAEAKGTPLRVQGDLRKRGGGMGRPLGALIAVLCVSSVLTACGKSGGSGSTAPQTALLGTLCGPSRNLLAGRSCPGGLCKSGLVVGSADDNAGPYSMTFSASDCICTRACNTAADCQGISLAAANNLTVVAENWTCGATSSGKYCAVSTTAPSGGGNSCSICGGAFCSGNCIGCPQCAGVRRSRRLGGVIRGIW